MSVFFLQEKINPRLLQFLLFSQIQLDSQQRQTIARIIYECLHRVDISILEVKKNEATDIK